MQADFRISATLVVTLLKAPGSFTMNMTVSKTFTIKESRALGVP